ncbi:MAG: class I SAM-dependent methyltransferase [Candidatus Hydrogenedentales bacterium]|jgi:ubiquinone/menaquinone biosynthesis C-methylase UbiE
MGFYSRYIFPSVMHWVMSSGQMKEIRAAALAGVSGHVCEIGFGTGLNLPHYPPQVSKITAVDPNPGMDKRAQRQIEACTIPVEKLQLDGESLPFEDRSFDCVVSTWTLCSIPNVDNALDEVRRILKPGGRFFFVEHGLADDPKVQRWQHRLNPLQKLLGGGCHLNRDIRALINARGFHIEHIETFYLNREPSFAGFQYKGTATVI